MKTRRTLTLTGREWQALVEAMASYAADYEYMEIDTHARHTLAAHERITAKWNARGRRRRGSNEQEQ